MKVLIIDQDDDANKKLIAELTKAQVTAILSPTGTEGLRKVSEFQPDAILLGEILSDTTGNLVLQQLKSNEATKNIPVAILSKFNHQKMEKEAIDAGASNYILRYQIEPSEIINRVERMIADVKGGTGWQPTNEPLVSD